MQKQLRTALLATVFAPMAMMAQVPITFTNQTALLPTTSFSSGNAVGVCDMNNDGLDDIVRDSMNQKMFIDFQQPNGTFTETRYTTGSFGSPWGLCVGDYNNDGYNDVFQGSSSNGYVLTSNSAASFTLLNVTSIGGGSVFTQGCNYFDIDNDGFLDVLICHDTGMPKIYKGNGTTGWVFDQSLIPMAQVPASDNSGNYASIWTDINNDGYEDMMITHCRQGVTNAADARRIDQIFINNGNGTYTQDVTNWTGLRDGEQGWSTGWGDIDNDGDMDAFVLNQTVNAKLMINNGSGVFTDMMSGSGITNPTSWFGENASFHDFDNDGWVDLLLTGDSSLLYHNNGNYTFTRAGTGNICPASTGRGMRGQGVGDLNNDGFLDVYASYCSLYNSPSTSRRDRMYFNDSPNQGNTNNYIKFFLVGGATPTMSNKNGIGAIVKIYGSFGVQIRDVRSGEGYGLQNTMTVHFGLGANTSIDSVVVSWPSGIVDEFVNLSANSTYTINENSSPLAVNTFDQSPFDISVYPNPTSSEATIRINHFAKYGLGNLSMNIYNAAGQVVYSEAALKSSIITLDRSILSTGMYFVEIMNGDSRLATQKLVVE